jgi:flagellar biosynthesis/type III secretory pathway protein FliH
MNSEIIDDKYEKEAFDQNYKKGYDDGVVSAEAKSYENGFREGVQNGLEIGYYIGFLNTLKTFVHNKLEKDSENKIYSRISALLEKNREVIIKQDDLEEIKKIYKVKISI